MSKLKDIFHCYALFQITHSCEMLVNPSFLWRSSLYCLPGPNLDKTCIRLSNTASFNEISRKIYFVIKPLKKVWDGAGNGRWKSQIRIPCHTHPHTHTHTYTHTHTNKSSKPFYSLRFLFYLMALYGSTNVKLSKLCTTKTMQCVLCYRVPVHWDLALDIFFSSRLISYHTHKQTHYTQGSMDWLP